MSPRGRKYLSDMLVCIDRIQDVLQDVNFEKYQADYKIHLLIERLLSIIGEATVQYSKLKNVVQLENHIKIRGMRNRLIHNYDDVEPLIIWNLIQIHIPKLKIEIEELLEKP